MDSRADVCFISRGCQFLQRLNLRTKLGSTSFEFKVSYLLLFILIFITIAMLFTFPESLLHVTDQ